MIKTLIEVSAEDEYQHGAQLVETLDKLGYEPKKDAAHGAFLTDLSHALRARGLDAWQLVQDYRETLSNNEPKAPD